jgi:hypothetical protein
MHRDYNGNFNHNAFPRPSLSQKFNVCGAKTMLIIDKYQPEVWVMADGETTLFSVSSDPKSNTVQVKVAEPVLEAIGEEARSWGSRCRSGSCRNSSNVR